MSKIMQQSKLCSYHCITKICLQMLHHANFNCLLNNNKDVSKGYNFFSILFYSQNWLMCISGSSLVNLWHWNILLGSHFMVVIFWAAKHAFKKLSHNIFMFSKKVYFGQVKVKTEKDSFWKPELTAEEPENFQVCTTGLKFASQMWDLLSGKEEIVLSVNRQPSEVAFSSPT